MLRRDLLFITGAAFSAEMDLPLGGKLRSEIQNLIPRSDGVPPDEPFAELLARHAGHRPAAVELRSALAHAQSIDNLVEHRGSDSEFVTVAKWAIARAISKAELNSKLRPKALRAEVPTENSYNALFQLIVAGIPRNQMQRAFSRLQVITFNYDRTLEVFLHRAIRDYSGVSSADAVEILNQATIIHAYGALGASEAGSVRPTQFRPELGWQSIEADAQGLRTYSEKEDSQSVEIIRQLVGQAEQLVVLGCAFHPQNLRLIKPQRLEQLRRVYATAYLPPPPDEFAHPSFEAFSLQQGVGLKAAILAWPSANPHTAASDRIQFLIEAMTCRQLFAMHGSSWRE